jgi:transposase
LDCRRCGGVKLERLDFLADNPRYTERFAMDVGARCRRASVRDVGRELKLDWHTVKTLEKQYMRAQLAAAGAPSPAVIGIDEISVGSVRNIVCGSFVDNLKRGPHDAYQARTS